MDFARLSCSGYIPPKAKRPRPWTEGASGATILPRLVRRSDSPSRRLIHAHDPPCEPRKRWRRIDLLPKTSVLPEYGGSPMLIGAEAVPLPCRLVGSLYEVVAVQRRRVHAGDLHHNAGPRRSLFAREVPVYCASRKASAIVAAVRQVAAPAAKPKSQPRPEEPRCRDPSIGITVDKRGKFEARNGGPDRDKQEARRGLEAVRSATILSPRWTA
jgi:hypothetical protein